MFARFAFPIVLSLLVGFQASAKDYTAKLGDCPYTHCWVELAWFIPTSIGFGTHRKLAQDPADYERWYGPDFIAPDFLLEETGVEEVLERFREALTSSNGLAHPEFDTNKDGVVDSSDVPGVLEILKQYGGDVVPLRYGGAGDGAQLEPGSCVKIRGLPGYFDPEQHLFQRLVNPEGVSWERWESPWAGPGVYPPISPDCSGGVLDLTR